MANQIARFFESQPGARAAELTAKHLKDFWDPRMRVDLARHLQAGGAGLSPVAASAAALLDPFTAPQAGAAPAAGTGDDAA
jgi:formate dehydrogenase subunit delta